MVAGASAVIVGAGVSAAPDPVVTPGPAGAEGDGTVAPTAGPEATDTATAQESGDVRVVDGPIVSNPRGDYQVRLHITDGVVTDVEFPVAGTSAAESVRVNDMALPVLEERIIEAQSGDIEYVSGASYTSPAIAESAQAAFDDAGL